MRALGAVFRSLVERWSRGIVVRRALPPDHGGKSIYVSPDASLRFWRRELATADPLLLALSRELVRPGFSVWDVGANVGLFTFASAFHAGATGFVLALEPDPWLASLLRRSSEEPAAGCAEVAVLQCAVSDRSGRASFSIAKRARAANHLSSVLGSTQSGGAREVLEVTTAALDDLLHRYRAPDVLKIDAEGAELLCLRGGERLLSSARPALLVEVSDESAAGLAVLLAAANYEFFDPSRPPSDRRSLSAPAWNTLALPREAVARSVAAHRRA